MHHTANAVVQISVVFTIYKAQIIWPDVYIDNAFLGKQCAERLE